jgi:integral membrane sensor domain MASE1
MAEHGRPCVLVAVLYVLAAKSGFTADFVAEQVSPVWPPTGLAPVGGTILRLSNWPGVCTGAFVANVTTQVPFAAPGGIATGMRR